MHGTYVEDRRIEPHERQRLYDEDVVKFGNEVTRGPGTCLVNDEPASFCCQQPIEWLAIGYQSYHKLPSNSSHLLESFPPLHVVVRYKWVDDRYVDYSSWFEPFTDVISHVSGHGRLNEGLGKLLRELPPNTFQVPDDDDEEDEDISFVHETVVKSKPQPLAHVDLTTTPEEAAVVCRQAGITEPDMLDRDRSKRHLLLSLTQASLDRSDEKVGSLSSVAYSSVTNSGPSGLSEAERQADKRAMHLDDNIDCSTASSKSTDQESPSKSSASLPTSSPSKQSDEHSDEKDHVCTIDSTSTQPTETRGRAMVVDQDLTQSESDSDEAYSPDLMVDESEDGHRHECLTDYGSESDEEALMVAESSGSKQAHDSKDSMDSESSPSDFSDDIAMEREEDIFELPKTKTSAAKVTYDFVHFDNHDKEPVGRVQPSYNMRPGNFTVPCTRLNQPSTGLNRAPSPSDAALAKPCDFATSSPGAMNGFNHFPTTQPWLNPMTPAYGEAWPCPLDGRPNHPYDGGFGGYPYSYGLPNCGPGQYNSDPFRTFPTPMPMVPDTGFNTVSSGSKQPDRPSSNETPQPQSQTQPPIVVSGPSNKSPIEVTHLPQNPPKPAAKVSINSIVDHASEESPSSQPGTNLKRKADEMDREDTTKSTTDNQAQVKPAAKISSLLYTPQIKTVAVADVQAMNKIPLQRRNKGGEEPPAKRARMANETGKPNFTTLAATALAGAIVGGVGVVAALVALPPDFFV